MKFKDLFTSNYQFDVTFLTNGDKMFLFAGGVCVLLALFLYTAARLAPTPVDKKYRPMPALPLLFAGISLAVWYAMRWQSVRFFGSHFAAWLVVCISLFWFGYKVFKYIKNYSKDLREWQKEEVKLKYLPK